MTVHIPVDTVGIGFVVVDKDELRELIAKAFADLPCPSDDYISIHRSSLEEIKGIEWQDVPLETLRRYRDELGEFTDSAFRYYIPAFLIALISKPNYMDTLMESILYDLSPPIGTQRQRLFNRKISQFTREQKLAIKAFVQGYRDLFPDGNWTEYTYNEFLEKVENYWEQFD